MAWTRIVPSPNSSELSGKSARPRGKREPCAYWVNIDPAGYVCSAQLKPSREAPGGQRQPPMRPGALVPAAYYAVLNDGTQAYASPDDVRAGTVAEELSKRIMVVGTRSIDVDGTPYLKTDHGLVEQSALGRFSPSAFAGLDLRQSPPLSWPFAWLSGRRGTKFTVYSEPSKSSEPARNAKRREIVPIFEERDGFVRIGESEWVERAALRIASITAPPPGLASGQQWIDVDLDEQVLVAYEGTTPVFATLVSTGRPRHETPPATYRVRAKAATTAMMGGEKNAPNRYEVSEVPWAIRFRNGLFIHAAYWHDAFGSTVSHGCVNVSPSDAQFLFGWVEPQLPEGWSEIEVLNWTSPIVRIRDRAHPAPEPHDYADEEQR